MRRVSFALALILVLSFGLALGQKIIKKGGEFLEKYLRLTRAQKKEVIQHQILKRRNSRDLVALAPGNIVSDLRGN
jgi:hypothetical protein